VTTTSRSAKVQNETSAPASGAPLRASITRPATGHAGASTSSSVVPAPASSSTEPGNAVASVLHATARSVPGASASLQRPSASVSATCTVAAPSSRAVCVHSTLACFAARPSRVTRISTVAPRTRSGVVR
jgi:hypothetical protein